MSVTDPEAVDTYLQVDGSVDRVMTTRVVNWSAFWMCFCACEVELSLDFLDKKKWKKEGSPVEQEHWGNFQVQISSGKA